MYVIPAVGLNRGYIVIVFVSVRYVLHYLLNSCYYLLICLRYITVGPVHPNFVYFDFIDSQLLIYNYFSRRGTKGQVV